MGGAALQRCDNAFASIGGLQPLRDVPSSRKSIYESSSTAILEPPRTSLYNPEMERKIFWTCFIVLGLLADFLLPLWWALAATIPILYISWWVAYRSDWFE